MAVKHRRILSKSVKLSTATIRLLNSAKSKIYASNRDVLKVTDDLAIRSALEVFVKMGVVNENANNQG